MICSNCRRETAPERFCIHCGARLGRGSGSGATPPSRTVPGNTEERLGSINQEIALALFLSDEIENDSGRLSQESRRLALREVDYWQADLLLSAAQLHREQGQWEQALEAARRTLGLRPSDAEAKYICGLAYRTMSQPGDAVRCFLEAIEARPGWSEPRVSLADFYESQGQPSEAIRELREYARVTNDVTVRDRVRIRAQALSEALPQYGLGRPEADHTAQTDTPQHLAYAVDSVEMLHRNGVLSADEANQLQEDYAQRRQALGLPATRQPKVRAAPAAPATSRDEVHPSYSAPAAGGGLTAFLTALLSERNLHAVLYIGAMLLLVSSVAITAISWDQADSAGEWGVRQAVLTVAGLLFFWIGHIIRTKSPADRSAGTLLTVGALWVPIAVGHIVYRFIEPQGETIIPGLNVALDLPTEGWLIIAAAGVPAYALLAFRFQLVSMAAAAGVAFAASLGLALGLTGLPGGWDLALMTSLGPVYLWVSRWARHRDSSVIADGLWWLAHLGVPATFVALVAIQAEVTSALAVTAWSAVALYGVSRFYARTPGYEYALGVAFPAALLLTLSTASSIHQAWYAPALMAIGAVYLAIARLNQRRPEAEPDSGNAAQTWPTLFSPYHALGIGLVCVSLLWAPMWPGEPWAARLVTLYGAAAAFGASYRFLRPGTLALAYLSVGLLAVAFLVTLSQTPLPDEWYGIAFAVLGAAYVFFGVRVFPEPLATAGGRLEYLLRPHLLGAWVLSVVALAWFPMWSEGEDASRIATLYTAAVIYGASAYLLRPRAWFLVFFAGALLPLAFFLTLLPLGLGPTWYGLVLAPFAAVYWLAAEVLRDFPRMCFPRFRPDQSTSGFIIDSPGAPLYLLAIGLSLAIPALSVFQPWVLATSLFISAGSFFWPAWIYRRSVWLYPSLAAAYLGTAQVLYLATDGSWNLSGAYFGVVVIVVGSAAAWLARQRRMETIDVFRTSPLAALAGFWSVPLWIFTVIGLVFSLASSMLEPQTGFAMALVYGIFAGAFAVWWRNGIFAYGSAFILLGVGLPAGLWAGGVQLVHAPLYGTGLALAIGVLFHLAGRGRRSTLRESIWAVWSQPVRYSILALVAAATVVSLTHAGVTFDQGDPGALRAPGTESDHFRWFAIVLAASGLNAIFWAFADRNRRLTYLGTGLVGISYMVFLGVFQIGQPLFYVVPAGLFMMAVAFAERRWGDRSAAHTLEAGGLVSLLGVTLGLSIWEAWQFFGEDSHFYYGVWLFFSSLAIFLWGGMVRWKWTFLAGIAVFVANFLTLLSLPVELAGGSISWWWIVLAIAVLLIGGAAVLELRREQLIAVSKEALERLEAWS